MKRSNQIYQREQVKVLLAMADPAELSTLEYLIVGQSFDYRKENTPHTALKTARKYKPDLVIIDVVLPEFDGIEVARKLKGYKKYNHTRFIFLTEKVVLVNKKDPVYSPDDYNIMKPLNIDNIKRKLDCIFSF